MPIILLQNLFVNLILLFINVFILLCRSAYRQASGAGEQKKRHARQSAGCRFLLWVYSGAFMLSTMLMWLTRRFMNVLTIKVNSMVRATAIR